MLRLGRGSASVLLLALATVGCPSPRAKRSASPSPASAPPAGVRSQEAERTRRMEQQARDIQDRWKDVQTMEGSDADKERAVQELMDRQQQLNREGQGEPAAPPPPE